MSEMHCPNAVPLAALVDYWLDEQEESSLEEHLFACGHCSATLGWIAGLADAIPDIVRRGETMMVLTQAFLERLRARGMRIREYRMGPAGSVNCTIAPTDDLVVAHLEAPLAGVTRLDLVASPAPGVLRRVQDLPFDVASGKVLVAPRTRDLRSLGQATEVARLVAVEHGGERVLGEYTFHHSPFQKAT